MINKCVKRLDSNFLHVNQHGQYINKIEEPRFKTFLNTTGSDFISEQTFGSL